MPADPVFDALARSGFAVSARPPRPVTGGSISRALRIETSAGPLLVKREPGEWADLLDAEAASLEALRGTGALAVPRVMASGRAGGEAYLALEWLDVGGCTPEAERRLGDGLARLHRTSGEAFGWHRDNYIGRTPQRNDCSPDWTAFFADRRLGDQLALARRNGIGDEAAARCARLIEDLPRRLAGHSPSPSLLHGDLWGGNWGATTDGTPYVFDPAAYFGDREADLAMTRLFGGFGAAFYRAYDESWPLPDGWERRVPLYNLYHLLNHFNLFGGIYRAQVLETLRDLDSD